MKDKADENEDKETDAVEAVISGQHWLCDVGFTVPDDNSNKDIDDFYSRRIISKERRPLRMNITEKGP